MAEGSIFIKYNNVVIGYGQIIKEGSIPIIVNFGILKDYRSRGYGKLLLSYLVNILYDKGYGEVRIKVNPDNHIAFRLYSSFGFKKVSECYRWTKII